MVKDLQDIVTSIEKMIEIKDHDIILDIGCNDGTLLSLYSNKKSYKVGIDPAINLKEEAEKNCDVFINDYFSAHNYTFPDAKVITAIAMFYDLPDPNQFLEDIYYSLADDGIFVIQLTDLTSMLKVNAFDNICHEHLEYYTLGNLVNLFYGNNFIVQHVEYNNVNGKSIRIFARKDLGKRIKQSPSVLDSLIQEQDYLYENPLEKFPGKIKEIKNKVVSFIRAFSRGEPENYLPERSVFALGASTKGNTLLQVFGLDETDIQAIGEINKDKIGLFTPGTAIPIYSEEDIFKEKPDLIIILPWHFTETFEKVTREYRMKGGLVLFPLPEPYVLTDNGGFML